jgi:hypothetical protein
MTLIDPASRFHRIVRKLGRFIDPTASEFVDLSKAFVMDIDKPLGIYRGDLRRDDILFTNQAVSFIDGENAVRRILYADIQSVGFPIPASESILLDLTLRNALSLQLRIVGRQGNFRDVFEVGRFFMRVVEDITNK